MRFTLKQWPSLLNLIGDRLYRLPLLVLYLTDGCNSRCAMCDIWRNPRRNMALELAQRLADDCKRMGTRWVLLSGGEAMQHPQWPDIAAMFRTAGVRVLLLTNGLLVQRQAQAVADSVDELIVSLDGGTPQTYEAIRGVNSLERVLAGIGAVRELGVPVTTRTTVQRANFREIPLIAQRAIEAGANKVSYLAIDVSNPVAFGDRRQSGGVVDVAEQGGLNLAEIDELETLIADLPFTLATAYTAGHMAETPEKLQRTLAQYFRSLLGEGGYPPPPCNAPHFSTVVEVDGTLRPCYFLPAYGRLTPARPDLAVAVNEPAARDLRQAYRTGQRAECERCVCPLHKGPRQLLQM